MAATTTIKVTHGAMERSVAIPRGLAPAELSDLLSAAFHTQEAIAGLEDTSGCIYPLSLICSNPTINMGSFKLLLKNSAASNSDFVNLPAYSPGFGRSQTAAPPPRPSLLQPAQPQLPSHYRRTSGQTEAKSSRSRSPSSGVIHSRADSLIEETANSNQQQQQQQQPRPLSMYNQRRASQGVLRMPPVMERKTSYSAYSSAIPSVKRVPSNTDDKQILRHIQDDTAFSKLSMEEILECFRQVAAESGHVDKRSFQRAFAALLTRHASESDPVDAQVAHSVATQLFDLFDKDRNGIVDLSEFLSGLSLLCRASSDDKIRAAFMLYDLDGDGFITLNEMARYLTGFFEVCFHLEPDMQSRFQGARPVQIATATAEHCFKRADLDGDGKITFDEFKGWYASDDAWAQSSILPR